MAVFGDAGQELNPESHALLTTIADQAAEVVEKDSLRKLAAQAAVLEERQRLARDLHDSLTQSLYAISNFATAARDQMRADRTARALEQLEKLEGLSRQALREMRLLIFELRPFALGEGGLIRALQERLDIVEKHAGVKTQLRVDLDRDLPAEWEGDLYGIATEALNNALQHAEAGEVQVRLTGCGSALRLEVADDGIGFPPEPVRAGLGLTTMRERAQSLGGRLEVESHPNGGSIIRVLLDSARPAEIQSP
jgi:signal transduction histidine kinase